MEVVVESQRNGNEAATYRVQALVSSGACFASTVELQLYRIVKEAPVRGSDGNLFQIVGLSNDKSSPPEIWSIDILPDGST